MPPHLRPRPAWTWAIALVLVPAIARADGFENVPTGSRTAAMGGAGHARGADSAAPTLNPAGMALIPGSIASLSASLYQITAVRIPAFITDGTTVASRFGPLETSDPSASSNEFSAFPSGVAYFLHLEAGDAPLVLAASLSVPRSSSKRFVESTEYKTDAVSIQESLSTLQEDQTYVTAISGAVGLGQLRLGLSVLGAYTQGLRSTERSALEVQGTSGFVRDQVTEIDRYSSIDLGALVGAQLDLGESFTLGASVRSPSLHLTGSYEGSVDFTNLGSEIDAVVSKMRSNGEAYRGMPMRFGLGAELRGDGWAAAADGLLYLPIGELYRFEAEQFISEVGGQNSAAPDRERAMKVVVPTRPVINVALGFELEVTETNWLRLGAFTDFSALEPASVQAERFAQAKVFPLFDLPIGRVGGSVGWGTRLGVVDTTIGIRAAYGRGQTLRIDPDVRFDYQASGRADVTDAMVFDGIAFLSAALDVSESVRSLGKHAQKGMEP